MKVNYTPPKVDYKKRRKSVAIPDQSLSIQEIVRRYVRGVPVDVVQRRGVYLDQQDHDLEKLSRMDFAEKAEFSERLAEQAADLQTELEASQRAKHERAKEQKAKEEQAAKAKQPPPGGEA